MKQFIAILLGVILLTGCRGTPQAPGAGGVAVKLTSLVFTEGNMIPSKYTCDGQGISPPLSWSDVPASARSLALIADDPDAPAGTWVHWVIFNLPATLSGLPEQVPRDKAPNVGGVQGTNSWPAIGYGGPCPPSGTHRYFFKLYALDSELNLTSSATAGNVQAAMKGRVLAEAQLMGRYQRTK
jgi:Raf kinase inhibitor-like YbhB/YbcL family protein